MSFSLIIFQIFLHLQEKHKAGEVTPEIEKKKQINIKSMLYDVTTVTQIYRS